MSFLSREGLKLLGNADQDKLYEFLTDKFNSMIAGGILTLKEPQYMTSSSHI